MALASATISMSLADLVGDAFDPRRVKVYASTNIPTDTVIDTAGNEIRLGTGSSTVDAQGNATLTVLVPGAGSNPASWQTYVHVDYPDKARQERVQRTFGPFTVTADANLADLISEQEVPPAYLSEVTAALDEKVAQAEAAAALAQDVSNIATPDALVKTLVQTPTSATAVALSASTAAFVKPALDRFVQRPSVYGVELWGRGTSYTAGANSSTGNGYMEKVRVGLNSSKYRNSASGGSNTPVMPAQYMDPNFPCAYAPDATSATTSVAGAGVWTPGTSHGLVVIEAGIGEALSAKAGPSTLDTTTRGLENQNRLIFEQCVVMAMRWHRATAKMTGSNATVTRGAGWNEESLSVPAVAFAGYSCSTSNATLTWKPGVAGEITLIMVAWRQSDGETNNSAYEIAVDGATVIKNTTKGKGDVKTSAQITFYSERITGLTPTSTVVIKKTGADKLWMHKDILVQNNPHPDPIILVQDCYLRGPQLTAPTGITAVAQGTAGTTSRKYLATAVDSRGRETNGGSSATPNTTNATLDATNFVRLGVTAVPGAAAYNWYRWNATVSQWLYIGSSVAPTFDDIGYADGQSSSPAVNATGTFSAAPWSFPIGSPIATDPLRNNETLDAYRAILNRIAASPEFADGTVAVADPNPRFDASVHIHADRIHPNNDGHQVYADAVLAAARRLAYQAPVSA